MTKRDSTSFCRMSKLARSLSRLNRWCLTSWWNNTSTTPMHQMMLLSFNGSHWWTVFWRVFQGNSLVWHYTEGSLVSSIVICDISHQMSNVAKSACLGLSLLISSVTAAPFKNFIITFSDKVCVSIWNSNPFSQQCTWYRDPHSLRKLQNFWRCNQRIRATSHLFLIWFSQRWVLQK